jgi:CRP-like cAMP-binding protein
MKLSTGITGSTPLTPCLLSPPKWPQAGSRRAGNGRLQADKSNALRNALQQAWPNIAQEELALLALTRLGRSHRIPQHGRLFPQGSHNETGSLWLLVRGKLSMGRYAANGSWRQSRALQGGQWIDLASAWQLSAYPETGEALTPLLIHELPGSEILNLCRHHPSVLQALVNSLGSWACEAMETRQALSTQAFPARLADWLLQQAKIHGSPDTLGLGLLKRDLAAQLSVTPETLSRTLRSFHEQGLISMQSKQIRLLDPARLAALNGPHAHIA